MQPFSIMAVLYNLYQDTRSTGTRKFYARAVPMNEVHTEDLAQKIEEKCTLNKADIVACIVALINEMKYELKNSNVVVLDGFGNFKLGLTSAGAEREDQFTTDFITGVHCNFLPTGKVDKNTGKVIREFTSNVKFKKYGE